MLYRIVRLAACCVLTIAVAIGLQVVVVGCLVVAAFNRLIFRMVLTHALLRLHGLGGCTRLRWLLWLVQLREV